GDKNRRQRKKCGELLCGMLNLPPPPTKFSDYTEFLERNLREVSKGSMMNAAMEAKRANGGNGDLTVAIDGTWQRGDICLIMVS
ncbi:hypothetical protein ANN_04838, partial [Periplaneta americana]